MTDRELLCGTRNARIHVYRDEYGNHHMAVSFPGTTAEYPISSALAGLMERDMVDGDTIRRRQDAGDW